MEAICLSLFAPVYIAYRKLRSAAPRRLEGRPPPSREAGNDEHCVRWLGCPNPFVAQAVVVRRAGRSVVVGGARPAGRAVVVARSSTSVPRRAGGRAGLAVIVVVGRGRSSSSSSECVSEI